ncbi:hypothetical protein LSH36_2165g00003, partial [Paralvinella palmiformis]
CVCVCVCLNDCVILFNILLFTVIPEIISFQPQSDDIIQGSTLNITCEVSSRPNSNITLTNINTSDTIVSVSDTQQALYTFNKIHVLDSGVYQCSATNGIRSMSNVTEQMTLYIKGGYSLCETSPTNIGLPLHVNMTISICLTANPFTQLTGSNWRFKSSESDYMINGLPNEVLTSVKDTNHPFKKYVMLMITKILESHYGTYTLQVNNRFNDEQLTHVISLLPEGKS